MDEEIKKIVDSLVTDQGLKVSGNGIIIEGIEKLLQKLDKIDTKLYWLEKRDKERSS